MQELKFKCDPSKDAVFGHGFADEIGNFDWNETIRIVENATEADVRRVLAKARRNVKPLTPEEFAILISPAADPFLEEMAQLSRHFTLERFGKTISMYIPMYVSNACTNKCVYCGFNHDNPFTRTTLTPDQVENECKAIKKLGPFENLLVVSGEYPSLCGVEYLEKVLHRCRPYFHNLTIEVQPMKAADYYRLTESGLNGVVCFQETYHREAYKKYHPRGMKSHFDWRLNGFDRMGEAGVHKIGMGVLLGLEDWRADTIMMARHLRYLQKRYWRSRFSVNFPRMRPSESGYQPKVIINDRELARLTFAFRIFDHDIDISFSTREAPYYRDHIMRLGVTSMSAGSQTEPGGYATSPEALEQFEVSDDRSPMSVAEAIRTNGYEPVWKDWDAIFD
ncbi:MAG: 2-iminoacetate synthase ThiH [Muribaculaceae bacterium]|jgi:2-iminoacetate synthase|uniref:2-iminoacetate synthase ThiH n=1 Tax=Sangeribacter muris TaxID=2880703 RepID=UPI000F51A41A|nr:2-iminoacetate synthase ThiH [Sangeribacter muris]MCX4281028.1 2-iminoacetate synthase ThiH [Muribaculaceae bacterium]ROS85012.1 2-iminoacetate synthase ThiH [Muribaculaceae bacterium Isolate-036 (Harlan)]RXE68380.1 2-iminoacetate synthase ThiH [Muribaculaceae bacterium Isolate-001 (NCI)]GFI39244.1 2-iminoacetate synthase [Muribaculaceae bacterium]